MHIIILREECALPHLTDKSTYKDHYYGTPCQSLVLPTGNIVLVKLLYTRNPYYRFLVSFRAVPFAASCANHRVLCSLSKNIQRAKPCQTAGVCCRLYKGQYFEIVISSQKPKTVGNTSTIILLHTI